jgi:hypothetical protein
VPAGVSLSVTKQQRATAKQVTRAVGNPPGRPRSVGIGATYEAFTNYLGWREQEAGKTMALAAYGGLAATPTPSSTPTSPSRLRTSGTPTSSLSSSAVTSTAACTQSWSSATATRVPSATGTSGPSLMRPLPTGSSRPSKCMPRRSPRWRRRTASMSFSSRPPELKDTLAALADTATAA